MITLRLNPYTEKEKTMLAFLLNKMEDEMNKLCKKGETCRTCEYRHLCYDITSAKDHAFKIMNTNNENR